MNQELRDLALEARRRFAPLSDGRVPGLRDWISIGGTYYVSQPSAAQLVLECLDESWREANGGDSDRFLWASRESVVPRSAVTYDQRSIGWAAITSYYSAFFSVQSLLRMFGCGYLYLTEEDAARLSAAPGVQTAVRTGVFGLRIELGVRAKLTLTKLNVKGVHEGFWRFADGALSDVSQVIASGGGFSRAFPAQTRADALISLEQLRRSLGEAGRPREIGWMSALRNEINYQLKRESWEPSLNQRGATLDRIKIDIQAMIRRRRERIGATLRMDPDVRALFECSALLYRDVAALGNVPSFQ